MIGEVILANAPFYDIKSGTPGFKVRPFLVIGQADKGDYTVLPLSRVTRRENLDPHYDVEIDPQKYPLLKLKALSYVRTHKATVVNLSAVEYRGGI